MDEDACTYPSLPHGIPPSLPFRIRIRMWTTCLPFIAHCFASWVHTLWSSHATPLNLHNGDEGVGVSEFILLLPAYVYCSHWSLEQNCDTICQMSLFSIRELVAIRNFCIPLAPSIWIWFYHPKSSQNIFRRHTNFATDYHHHLYVIWQKWCSVVVVN